MKEEQKRNPYRYQTLVTLVVLILAHLILLHWLNGSNAFAVLTASGQNMPLLTLLSASIFIGLRLYLYLVVPGMIVARIGGWSFDRYIEKVTKT